MALSNVNKPSLNRTRTHESKDDSNLCRICRGEATEQEPLYHPCKCSGSIMYVHQECLMEWLSHSQKKHCELCKTSFRFTKLYHPDMPERLPTGVFLRKAAAHVARNLLYGMRACLVVCTWSIWLPWTMRFVWWGLFWLADVGWVKDPNVYSRIIPTPQNTTIIPTSNIPNMTASAFVAEMAKGSAILRTTSWILRHLASGNSKGLLSDRTPDNHLQSQALVVNSTQLSERGTLLSSVRFLNSMTSSQLANRVLIDVLEGQIITSALVALIILILLIREWVVQQQPIANLINDNQDVQQALQRHAQNGEQRAEEPAASQRPDQADDGLDSVVRGLLQASAESRVNEQQCDVDSIRSIVERAQALGPQLRHHNHHRNHHNHGTIGSLFGDSRMADANRVVEDALQSMIALGHAYAIAVRDSDLRKIQSVRRSIREMRVLMPLLPSESADSIGRLAREIKRSMREMIPMVKAKVSDKEMSTSNADLAGENAEMVPLPDSEGSETHSDDDSSTSSPETRPAMPPREESSVATEIQRKLQERSMDFQQEDGVEDHNDTTSSTQGLRHSASQDFGVTMPDLSITEDADTSPDFEVITGLGSTQANSHFENHLTNQDSVTQQEPAAESVDHTQPHGSVAPDPLLTPNQQTAASSGEVQQHELNADRDDEPDPDADADADAVAPPVSNDQNSVNLAEGQENKNTVMTKLANWIWGDLDADRDEEGNNADHEEIVDVALAEPVDDLPANGEQAQDDNPGDPAEHVAPPQHPQDAPEDAEAAPAQGLFNDADAMEDAEDLEGVMELIGMQGAMSNLFTNAMFASVFVSCTIVIAVWLPFLIGKVALIMLAHPLALVEAPFKIITYATNTMYDLVVLFIASALQWLVLKPAEVLVKTWQEVLPACLVNPTLATTLENTMNEVMGKSSVRLFDTVRKTWEETDNAYSTLTIDSHAAIRSVQRFSIQAIRACMHYISDAAERLYSISWTSLSDVHLLLQRTNSIAEATGATILSAVETLSKIPHWIMSGNITITYSTTNVFNDDDTLAPWTALDRGLATTVGYAFVALIGAIYFMRIAPLATSRHNKKVEGVILEILQQAGGIAKVVLIISIEMLGFPLYCGLLLDVAMLPLFQDASLQSRVHFSRKSPWTSLFVHWFVGTAYMFHFALFVAMCRKIFRKGVLYFIRDPDDPTFHPVRDVLERSVISQLRKIASSALIYGGLVIVCVGGIIWGLSLSTRGVLPIQWMPYSDANAFPIDLIFYIFLRPLAMKHLALSDWLQEIYKWFFRRCAKALDLSHFLFNDKVDDEQQSDPDADSSQPRRAPTGGKFLRVPASDQIRVGRGNRAFVEVDGDGNRIDGRPEPTNAEGKRPKKSDFITVAVPKYFRLRLIVFVTCIWLLTAGIGFTLTVFPLVLGRTALSIFTANSSTKNDIYAFAIGIFLLCGAALLIAKIAETLEGRFNLRYGDGSLKDHIQRLDMNNVRESYDLVRRLATQYFPRVARCAYTYAMLWCVIAFTFSLILQFYVLCPIFTLVHDVGRPHIIHARESLVIGVQLVRGMMSLLGWTPESRGARALDAIFEAGYFNPNARLANRYLFLPTLAVSMVALFGPISAAWVVNRIFFPQEDAETKVLVQVLSYPVALGLLFSLWAAHLLVRATGRWRTRIRDEVFLIGERLHNYGEKKPPSNARHSSARRVP